ncbi:hypothetical protein [Pedobacter sp. ASV12]|uniref:hypothetical protein n=1 Tax=Pedobacter sp. ASV12 TaxID=2795120 RepID=UPI00351C24E8
MVNSLWQKELAASNFDLCLSRLTNIASHEILHLFTMAHCTFAKCTMNGSNTLSKTDICTTGFALNSKRNCSGI